MSNLSKQYDRLPTIFVKDCGYIPMVLTNAATIIEKHIKTKDLFQTQGLASKVPSSLSQLSRTRITSLKNASVHDVIEALKAYLVRLPEPLMSDDVCDSLIAASQADSTNKYSTILADFRKSSPHHYSILHFMMRLLHKVSLFSEYNFMDVRKLATIFVLDVIKPLNLEESNDVFFLTERMQRLPYLIMVIENLIKNVSVFTLIGNQKATVSPPKGSPSLRSISQHRSLSSLLVSKSTCEAGATSVPTRPLETASLGDHQQGEDTHVKKESSEVKVSPLVAELATGQVLVKPTTIADANSDQELQRAKRLLSVQAQSPERRATTNKEGLTKEELASTLNLYKDTSPLREEAGTQAGRSMTRSKIKKCSPIRSATNTNKSSANTDSSARGLLKGKRLCTGGALNTAVKPPRSVEKKHFLRQRSSNFFSRETKPKHKIRKCSKKILGEKDRTKLQCGSRDADFSAFHPDEEIAPWNDAATNSDDTSVMTKTIRNPRILPISNLKRTNREASSPDAFSKGGGHSFLVVNSGFRTTFPFEGPNVKPYTSGSTTMSDSSAFHSDSTTLSDMEEHRKTGGVYFSQSINYSDKEVATLSKELIKGIQMKSSVGAFTEASTKGVKKEQKKSLDTNKTPVGSGESKVMKNRSSGVSSSHVTKDSEDQKVREVTSKSPAIAVLKTESGLRVKKWTNNSGTPVPCNDPRSLSRQSQLLHAKFAAARPRSGSALRFTHTGPANHREAKDPFKPSSSLSEWLVDIFLISITFVCTGFVFYIHQYSK